MKNTPELTFVAKNGFFSCKNQILYLNIILEGAAQFVNFISFRVFVERTRNFHFLKLKRTLFRQFREKN